MKKILVLAALSALVATSAMAAITGTKHDLSSANGSAYATDSSEICVFCHTPHGAVTSTKYTPLWNRTDAIEPTNFYTSTSMNHLTSLNATIATDAYLCLSCHDGAQFLETLNNPPNTGLTDNNTAIAGTAALDQDLSNDHPIGFVLTDGTDAEIYPIATIQNDLPFFGAGEDEMWCSSCHDVHGGAAGTPFLHINNAGSNLCLTCHNK